MAATVKKAATAKKEFDLLEMLVGSRIEAKAEALGFSKDDVKALEAKLKEEGVEIGKAFARKKFSKVAAVVDDYEAIKEKFGLTDEDVLDLAKKLFKFFN